jgi:hypothetical protein
MRRLAFRILIFVMSFSIGVGGARVIVSWRTSVNPTRSQLDCSTAYDPGKAIKKVRQADDPFLFEAFQQIPVYEMPECVEEAYSLTWIPSFHPPVLVEVWRSGNKSFMVAKMLDRRCHLDGHPEETNARPLTDFEWRDFTSLLDRASYWQLPSTVDEVLPEDGATWIVDGLRAKQYQWVRRRVPKEQYAEVCKHLIQLSGLQTSHALYLP